MKNTNIIPEPDLEYGHSGEQIEEMCKKLNIDLNAFWEAFGVNTVAIDSEGRYCYYTCDIEKALYLLKKSGGKYHQWD